MRARAALPIVCATTIVAWATGSPAAEVTPAPPAAAGIAKPGWIGYAVSSTGRVFNQPSAAEDRARVFAQHECERTARAICSAIAVPKSWTVGAVKCGRNAFIAGVSAGSALPLARQKALAAGVRAPCRQVFPR